MRVQTSGRILNVQFALTWRLKPRIWLFSLKNLTFDPQNLAYKFTSNHLDSIFLISVVILQPETAR